MLKTSIKIYDLTPVDRNNNIQYVYFFYHIQTAINYIVISKTIVKCIVFFCCNSYLLFVSKLSVYITHNITYNLCVYYSMRLTGNVNINAMLAVSHQLKYLQFYCLYSWGIEDSKNYFYFYKQFVLCRTGWQRWTGNLSYR